MNFRASWTFTKVHQNHKPTQWHSIINTCLSRKKCSNTSKYCFHPYFQWVESCFSIKHQTQTLPNPTSSMYTISRYFPSITSIMAPQKRHGFPWLTAETFPDLAANSTGSTLWNATTFRYVIDARIQLWSYDRNGQEGEGSLVCVCVRPEIRSLIPQYWHSFEQVWQVILYIFEYQIYWLTSCIPGRINSLLVTVEQKPLHKTAVSFYKYRVATGHKVVDFLTNADKIATRSKGSFNLKSKRITRGWVGRSPLQ